MPEKIFALRNLSSVVKPDHFHLHNSFELYLFLQGDVNYFVEKSIYHLTRGTLLMFTNNEIHMAANLSSKTYERIVISFPPEIAKDFSTEHTNLLSCFLNRKKGENNAILLSKKQLNIYLALATKLIENSHYENYGDDVLATTYLIQMLIFINKIYKHDEILLEQYPLSEKLQDILKFIDNHLTEDLSLNIISEYFSLNKSYLGRLFKKETGSTIYNLILLKRITLAKQLLSEGKNVSEACFLSGFNDYSNFIRTFKQITGYSPTKYNKLHL
ncbi:AraC family transcriptional regulator [Clostridium sp. SHJSY1]|uniref:AraC family transcriptional regulator n=1 Tax=Clostridium sp. SHJSY1 TaxID=2942483 RepID=UPI0028756985|nr:AraC family transcriptional regulator [Clostridium sp. SHJSY1]MDS0526302.1 AraC family transcriptional regulator [Clostridium sp. SHJSY1]